MADIQKLDKASLGRNDDDNLLLESTKLYPLSSKDLHYLLIDDANSIPFPFEIKQKIHDIVEQVIPSFSRLAFAIANRCVCHSL